MNEMKIWTLEGCKATPLEAIAEMGSEEEFEDILTINPNMLLNGLTLVGRQNQTESGPLDLLGVDADGRLCVFELKRGTVAREAVAQVIDYASDLDGMGLRELAKHISRKSGDGGVDAIGDFRAWYGQKFEKGLDGLKPLRLFLVGLGADEATERMVKFLAANGVDISLLTFHGFAHAGNTLLAKHVEVRDTASTPAQTLDSLRQMADSYGTLDLFDSAVEMFRETWSDEWRSEFANRNSLRIDLYASGMLVSERPYARVEVYEEIWITFHRRAFTLCEDAFKKALESAVLEYQLSPQSQEDWRDANLIQFPLTADYWKRHKETLTGLAKTVYAAWMESGE